MITSQLRPRVMAVEPISEPARWVLMYRVKDGRALWRIVYDGKPLWQLCAPTHPPACSGGYLRLDGLLRVYGLVMDQLIEATP